MTASGASSLEPAQVHLRLYVTGRTPAALEAIAAVRNLEHELRQAFGACAIDVIDVLDDPDAALRDGIYATPTILRLKPGPARRIFGRIGAGLSLRDELRLDDAASSAVAG
ncbi:MAG: hypothetical protein K1X51_15455 [Rhodospirillaceae bacterium]|nr:hypothetical protein [Rhodospirillaceae bacterium]